MYEWNEAIQKMIDWIEKNFAENPTLLEMSKQIGYSPYYCSSRFHQIVGKTIKSYVAERRLCQAAFTIRDTDERILDIAVKYGYSSQQALTRAFVYAYGCTPAAYRKNPRPIHAAIKKTVLFPDYYQKGENVMNKQISFDTSVRVEYIPAHRYIAVFDDAVQSYFSFWANRDCDEICGIIESMGNVAHPVVGCHTAGWVWKNGKRGYSYGIGTDCEYKGKIPEGFEVKEYPASYYLVFSYPPFDFLNDCEEVVIKVEKTAWTFNPESKGFAWNETACQDYQRLAPETTGYEVLRPVVKQ